VREACVVDRLPSTSIACWPGSNRLRAKLGGRFDAVSRAMAPIRRSSSLVEDLNAPAAIVLETPSFHALPTSRTQRQ